MAVAGVQFAPGLRDADHRPIQRRVAEAHAFGEGAAQEATEALVAVTGEVAAKAAGLLLCHALLDRRCRGVLAGLATGVADVDAQRAGLQAEIVLQGRRQHSVRLFAKGWHGDSGIGRQVDIDGRAGSIELDTRRRLDNAGQAFQHVAEPLLHTLARDGGVPMLARSQRQLLPPRRAEQLQGEQEVRSGV